MQRPGDMVQSWSRDMNQGAKHLKPIIPVLFYHGRKTKLATRFSDLYAADLPEMLKRYQPDFHAQVFDLSSTPEEEIHGPALLQAILVSMKYVRERPDRWLAALSRIVSGDFPGLLNDPRHEEVILYVFRGTDATRSEFQKMIQEQVVEPHLKEHMMSLAEQLKLEGKEEGRQEGRQEEQKRVVRSLLESGMSVEKTAELLKMDIADVKALQQ